jgi:hypothetical protein
MVCLRIFSKIIKMYVINPCTCVHFEGLRSDGNNVISVNCQSFMNNPKRSILWFAARTLCFNHFLVRFYSRNHFQELFTYTNFEPEENRNTLPEASHNIITYWNQSFVYQDISMREWLLQPCHLLQRYLPDHAL